MPGMLFRIREFCRRSLLLTAVATLALTALATYSLVANFKSEGAAVVIYEGF